MGYPPPIVDFIAKKIARIDGVEVSLVTQEGAVDVILDGGYNRPLRERVLGIGMKAMVPVRVFYRMPDGRAIGEASARKEYERNAQFGEAIEDYYTRIHVAGFAGEPAEAPPDQAAGDSYGTDVKKDTDSRDDYGQLKLSRIRGNTRGRPVVGWKYGKHTLRKGSEIKFRKDACLQWTMGRTMSVKAGAHAMVTSLASKRPLVYLSMGGYDQIELPIHAVGHVYDVMVDPQLESRELHEQRGKSSKVVNNTLGYLSPEMKRLVMTIGFGRHPGQDDTPSNKAHFRGPKQPDMHGYQDVGGNAEHESVVRVKIPSKSHPDALGDVDAEDPRFAPQHQRDPRSGKKTILLGKK